MVFGRPFSALCVLFCTLLSSRFASADIAAFDLAGPVIDVRVQRNGRTLPISQVPNLQTGDRLWIHPALPRSQAVRYLLVTVFLRGATNPPPEDWFTQAETWTRKIREEGIFVTVPEGAEQAVIFLAPDTTGGFSTLRSAVRGRPGSFVRAIQDLEQASLDRSRLDTYLTAMHQLADGDPAKVHDQSVLLARSLSIRLEDDCFRKLIEQQAACLTQKSDNLVLNDGHSQTMVGALTQGHASDLIGQITYTPTAGSGYFSPYVGAIVDMARILDALHTAQYQYIPALALPREDQLQLKLNTAPSFHNPKSVIVAALPAIRQEMPPPLRAVEPQQSSCLQKTPLVLQVSGAPLAYSTGLLHDLVLRVEGKNGPGVDLPAKADPLRGGYVIDTHLLAGRKPGDLGSVGTLRGQWGFDSYTGPAFPLQSAHPAQWSVLLPETASLLAGHEHTFSLHAEPAACVVKVAVKDPRGNELAAAWKVSKPDEVEVKVPAGSATPGTLTLAVTQAGLPHTDEAKISIYAETGHLERFLIVPGEARATLRGSRLEEVAGVEVSGIHFASAGLVKPDELSLQAPDAKSTAALTPGAALKAKVLLKDGRSLDVPVAVEPPRPRVTLLSKVAEPGAAAASSVIQLTDPNELPLDGRLSFSLKSVVPDVFPRGEKIEIAAGEDLRVMLNIADGSLTLQDPHTVLATLEPLKCFGKSAFGPLRFRPVDERGVTGDWQALATLVRIPELKELKCPAEDAAPCVLSGANLFLLQSVASAANFTDSVQVPEGFVGAVLPVPHAPGGMLFVKLRDDPNVPHTAVVPVAENKPAQ